MRTCVTFAVLSAALLGQSIDKQIEPNAGTWKPWVISSGKDFRVPPPPDMTATAGELKWLHAAVGENDPSVVDSIAYWSAGAPSYRWIELITARVLSGAPVTAFPHRVYTYVAQAMYDATVAAWDSKYAYNRRRPSEADPTLTPRLSVPPSPSYPSAHAATAAAATAVLSYFFPTEAAAFQSLAETAGKSQLYAGLEYPTDYFAGMDLGRRVGQQVVDRAKADGSDAVWTGTVPTGPCRWTGTSPPANVTTPNWTPILLSAANEFRPTAPPACDSPEAAAFLAEVKNFPRSPAAFSTNQRAMYWQSQEGINTWPYTWAGKVMFEDKLDQDAPFAARVYSMLAGVYYDTYIANHDAKFTYWYIRPSQLDPSISPIFPVPNHPSYPSNHAALSTGRAEVLAYLFPKHAAELRAIAAEAAESRLWAGIHYRMDVDPGAALGKSVAAKYVAWAQPDSK